MNQYIIINTTSHKKHNSMSLLYNKYETTLSYNDIKNKYELLDDCSLAIIRVIEENISEDSVYQVYYDYELNLLDVSSIIVKFSVKIDTNYINIRKDVTINSEYYNYLKEFPDFTGFTNEEKITKLEEKVKTMEEMSEFNECYTFGEIATNYYDKQNKVNKNKFGCLEKEHLYSKNRTELETDAHQLSLAAHQPHRYSVACGINTSEITDNFSIDNHLDKLIKKMEDDIGTIENFIEDKQLQNTYVTGVTIEKMKKIFNLKNKLKILTNISETLVTPYTGIPLTNRQEMVLWAERGDKGNSVTSSYEKFYNLPKPQFQVRPKAAGPANTITDKRIAALMYEANISKEPGPQSQTSSIIPEWMIPNESLTNSNK